MMTMITATLVILTMLGVTVRTRQTRASLQAALWADSTKGADIRRPT